ncbi:MAG TPA: anti-sigma factor [Actinomycetota bacterium]|nr:anti-sigma factor [Actinomycetota bacterium]
MREEHGSIEELLAAYALRALPPADAPLLDRLLAEHVPACPRCRDTLEGFQAVAGELGLAAPPAHPPEILLARLRRSVAGSPRRRRPAPAILAAGVAALLTVSGLAVNLGRRADQASSLLGTLTSAVAGMPAGATPVGFREEDRPGNASLVGIPNVERVVLVGRGVPPPAPGHVYRVWAGRDGAYEPLADFVPQGGVVILELGIDRGRYDEILITEEPDAPPGPVPAGTRRWSAVLD